MPSQRTAVEWRLRPLRTDGQRIVDDAGRQTILRGANVNSLVEYWEGVGLPGAFPMEDADWERAADYGFSCMRLLMSWSRLEPRRGEYDDGYLDEIDEYVTAAADRGIYTVLDMHQDVFSAYLHSPDDLSECPPDRIPSRGWDGAPEWAIRSDGAATWVTGPDRASADASDVVWRNFWSNRDGIRDDLVAAWAYVAARFVDRPEIAGYDLLNEPESPWPRDIMQPLYDDFLAACVRAIRAVEADAEHEHLLFLESALACTDPNRLDVYPSVAAFAGDRRNIVYSPHNYCESLSHDGSVTREPTVEKENEKQHRVARLLGVPAWVGEHAALSLDDDAIAVAHRLAADFDARQWGSAWWLWRQSYGDPHRLEWSNGGWAPFPSDHVVRLHLTEAVTNRDLGPAVPLLETISRSYAVSAPGTIVEMVGVPESGALRLRATRARVGEELRVWLGSRAVEIQSTGVSDVELLPRGRGAGLRARVTAASYDLIARPIDHE
jgi:endoglycosylceramidase